MPTAKNRRFSTLENIRALERIAEDLLLYKDPTTRQLAIGMIEWVKDPKGKPLCLAIGVAGRGWSHGARRAERQTMEQGLCDLHKYSLYRRCGSDKAAAEAMHTHWAIYDAASATENQQAGRDPTSEPWRTFDRFHTARIAPRSAERIRHILGGS